MSEESSSSRDYVYQLNAYFGVFYPAEKIPTVLDLCAKHPEYKDLGCGDNELITKDKKILFVSTNSDIEGECTMGFIAIDDLTIGGADEACAEDTYLNLEPADMDAAELKHKDSVSFLTGLYEFLVREFKKNKIPLSKLWYGWRVVSCVWDKE
jgi:hypothetical protein